MSASYSWRASSLTKLVRETFNAESRRIVLGNTDLPVVVLGPVSFSKGSIGEGESALLISPSSEHTIRCCVRVLPELIKYDDGRTIYVAESVLHSLSAAEGSMLELRASAPLVTSSLSRVVSVGSLECESVAEARLLGLLSQERLTKRNDVVEQTSSVLLHGPNGCGKSRAVRRVADHLHLRTVEVQAWRMAMQYPGEMERGYAAILSTALQSVPCLFVMDQAECHAPRYGVGEANEKAVRSILHVLEQLRKHVGVIAVLITSSLADLHPSIRQCVSDEILFEKQIVAVSNAAGDSLEQKMSSLSIRDSSAVTTPSASKDSVAFADVGGLGDIKQRLQEMILWRCLEPRLYEHLGVTAAGGLLLYGPPGTGKTLIAKALAAEAGVPFLYVNIPSIIKSFVGESEKELAAVFRTARQHECCVVFFDELQAIFSERSEEDSSDKLVSQLLLELDANSDKPGVIVIGATNRPERLDSSLLRPGRFDYWLFVKPPDTDARYDVLCIHTRRMPLAADVDLHRVASLTEGRTGADLRHVCRSAATLAIERNPQAETISMEDFEQVLRTTTPTLTIETLFMLQAWQPE